MASYWPSALMVFALTAIATGLTRRYALRNGLLDLPGPRRSHQVATPRGGGVSILLGLMLIGFILVPSSESMLMKLTVSTLGIGLLGWWDDHRSLSALFRIVVQTIVATLLVFQMGISFADPLEVALGLMAALGLVWSTNLFNFMDGSDGIAAMQAIVGLTIFAVLFRLHGRLDLCLYSGLTAVAVAGFLVWNLPFPRARIFLGDAGSGALGFLLAGLALLAVGQGVTIQLTFIAMSVFIVDATATLLLRLGRRERWYTAHRQHAYQRLLRGGWRHGQVLLSYVMLNLALVLPTLWWVWQDQQARAWWGLAFVASLLGCAWAWVQTHYNDRRVGSD